MKEKTNDYTTLSFRVPRNMVTRLKRVLKVEGKSQTAFLIESLERNLWRWEKEYARKVKLWEALESDENHEADE